MKFSRDSLIRNSILLFIFSIPFGMKKFLFDFPAPFKNYYTSEYASAFLYGSDILFLLFFLLLFFSKPLSWWGEQLGKLKKSFTFLLLFLILSFLSVFSAGFFSFSAYSFGRLVLGILAALAIGAVLRAGIIRFKEVATVISLAAVIQSIVGFLQFVMGKSVGLWFLGETVFKSGTPGIAHITVNGLKFARAYGTMPHANILAGFLVLGLIALFYFFIKEEKASLRMIQSAGIFVVFAGLISTFSRSGWITAIFSSVVFIAWEFFADKERRKRIIYLSSLLMVICLVLFVCLGQFIFPRANFSATEGPVADRWSYDKIGTELIISSPLGVGIGNQLFYTYNSGLFDKYNVGTWGQLQPIHNLYLIMGAEIGIAGLIMFLVFVGWLLISNFKFLISNQFPIFKLQNTTPIIMLASLLLFGLFDHFLWDLQSGRLMLWLVIGILLGVSSGEREPS